MRNRPRGFTLIELLIVVVIIGVLAAVAVPKLAAARERAYWSTLKSDLKSLATLQETYYTQHWTYTTDMVALDFTASDRVIVVTPDISLSTPAGQAWSATATHAALGPDVGCVIFDGAYDGTLTALGATATAPSLVACSE